MFEEPAGVLTLRQALGLALARNPALAAVSWDVRATEAEALQAGLMPNPEVRVSMVDFGGTGRLEGLRRSDQRIRLSQVIELGGKARKRRRVGQLDAARSGWDYETARLNVLAETARAFVAVLVAQRRLVTAKDKHTSAEGIMAAITKRVAGGMAAGLEAAEVRAEVGAGRIELDHAQRALASARGVLAGCWGGRTAAFERVMGDLDALVDIPAVGQLLPKVTGSPDVARWETEVSYREAAIELERANRIPDLRVLVGVQRERDPTAHGYMVGLEMAVPIFDHNQGNLRRARFRRIRAAHRRQAAVIAAQTALHQAYEMLSASSREVAVLKNDILPAAQERADTAARGLQLGAVTHLQVMKARRALFRAKGQLVEALGVFHTAVVDVERLIAEPIGDVGTAGGPQRGAPK